jgi:chromosome segregation ATPase
MHDNEPLDEKVKRLEAEAEALRKQLADMTADRDKYKEQYTWMAIDHLKRQPVPTQEEWDEAMNNPVSLRSLLDEWKGEQRDV